VELIILYAEGRKRPVLFHGTITAFHMTVTVDITHRLGFPHKKFRKLNLFP